MNNLHRACWLVVLMGLSARNAGGHGVPVNTYVKTGSGQLAVFDGYEHGELESLGGSDIFTDAPGIGVSSNVNGIAVGTPLMVNVVEGLLYWDGTDVTHSAETLLIDWPDDGGTSDVETYAVTAESGYQTGMLWGVYLPPGGSGSWDAHADYALESANPPPGVYGVVLQLAAAEYVASDPFLVPLVYDPLAAFGASKVSEGISALQQAVTPLPTADFDRNALVDADDLSTWQVAFGTNEAFQVQGDASGDGSVSGDDFLAWQTQRSSVLTTRGIMAIPEPSCLALSVIALVSCCLRAR